MDDRTKKYSEQETDKTKIYGDQSSKTRTYGAEDPSSKTAIYGQAGHSAGKRTRTHGLGPGDELELKGRRFQVKGIISDENTTLEAVIYRIADVDGTDFALKLYHEFHSAKDEPNPDALARIQKITDPDILHLYDFGIGSDKFQGRFCYEICSYAKGGTLLSVQDHKKKYTPNFLHSNIIPEIFKGIQTLHGNKIFHCDLKPQNVFYLNEEQTDLVIGDYGSAKTIEATSEKQTRRTSTFKGTDFYLAPEQARGIVSEKNDYYSFGMILVHLLYPELLTLADLDKIIERQFARKPIIDFNPSFGGINDLIAGLTLFDAATRWGEKDVSAWLRDEAVDINYGGTFATQIAPINLGQVKIQTVENLVDYITMSSISSWYENLIEDKDGYALLLRWIADLQGLEQKKVFDRMVRTYQQNGQNYVREAILHYFVPDRPVCVETKEYNIWHADNVYEQAKAVISHWDDIWKKTKLSDLCFLFFQLEFSLLHLAKEWSGDHTPAIRAILDKIYASLSLSPDLDFSDFTCHGYSDLTHQKLIDLFYNFNEKRKFRDLKKVEYENWESIGKYFAAGGSGAYNDTYNRVELAKYIQVENKKNLAQLTYSDFLFSIFSDQVKSEIKIDQVNFSTEGTVNIRYAFGKSLEDFFYKNGFGNNIAFGASAKHEATIKTGTIPTSGEIAGRFLQHIVDKYSIKKETISTASLGRLRKTVRKALGSEYKKTAVFILLSHLTLAPMIILATLMLLIMAAVIYQSPFLHIDAVVNRLPHNHLLNQAIGMGPIGFDKFSSLWGGFFSPVPLSFLVIVFILPMLFSFVQYPYAGDRGRARTISEIIRYDLLPFQKIIFWYIPMVALCAPIISCISVIITVILGAILALPGWIIFCVFGDVKWDTLSDTYFVIMIYLSYFGPFISILVMLVIGADDYIKRISNEKIQFKNVIIPSVLVGVAAVFLMFFMATTLNSKFGLEFNREAVVIEASINKTKTLAVVTAPRANIRSGPSTQHNVIATLEKNKEVELLHTKDGWANIQFDGGLGFIASNLITSGYTSASIKKIRVTTKATYVTLYVMKGTIHGPGHRYAMYLRDKETQNQYRLLSASVPFDKPIKEGTVEVVFEKLPKGVKHLDLIEGSCTNGPGCWSFYGIAIE